MKQDQKLRTARNLFNNGRGFFNQQVKGSATLLEGILFFSEKEGIKQDSAQGRAMFRAILRTKTLHRPFEDHFPTDAFQQLITNLQNVLEKQAENNLDQARLLTQQYVMTAIITFDQDNASDFKEKKESLSHRLSHAIDVWMKIDHIESALRAYMAHPHKVAQR